MQFENKKISPKEALLLSERCIWLNLSKVEESPFFLQFDWNVCGALSRTLRQMNENQPRSVFPTLKKLNNEYLVIERDFDPDFFVRTCEGMNFQSVAMVCDSEEQLESLKEKLKTLTLQTTINFYSGDFNPNG